MTPLPDWRYALGLDDDRICAACHVEPATTTYRRQHLCQRCAVRQSRWWRRLLGSLPNTWARPYRVPCVPMEDQC